MAYADPAFPSEPFAWRAPSIPPATTTSREAPATTPAPALREGSLPSKRWTGIVSALVIVVTAAALIAEVSEARSQTTDLERLQGAWECIATLKDGKQVMDYVGARAVMQGNRLTWHLPGPDGKEQTANAVFTIDAGKNPKHFDWYEENTARVHRRLYVLANDVLIWSTDLADAPRPQHFGAGRWLFVMRRIRN